ncbi:MAG: hypothetical protein KGO92_02200 [Bacteroidota bacterium]|nr:hypothetical protein [Bacteroidota bacterium]
MKTMFTLLFLAGMGSLSHLKAATVSKDSTETLLQARMKQMEIHVQKLQAEIRVLKLADSLHLSELQKLKNSLRQSAPRKLVISRVGSKQANIQ